MASGRPVSTMSIGDDNLIAVSVSWQRIGGKAEVECGLEGSDQGDRDDCIPAALFLAQRVSNSDLE